MVILGFQMGAPPSQQEPASMVDMSLDDMIASRKNESKSHNKTAVPKAVSNKDRSIATSRAKRDALMAARRGMSTTKKPTPMQIDKEVKKQTTKSQKQQQKTGGGGGAGAKKKTAPAKNAAGGAAMKLEGTAKAAARRNQRQQKQSAKKIEQEIKPTRKVITAAVKAVKETGFAIPQGMKMQITFVPTAGAAAAKPAGLTSPKKPQGKAGGGGGGGGGGPNRNQQQQPKKNNNRNRGGGGRGGGGPKK